MRTGRNKPHSSKAGVNVKGGGVRGKKRRSYRLGGKIIIGSGLHGPEAQVLEDIWVDKKQSEGATTIQTGASPCCYQSS